MRIRLSKFKDQTSIIMENDIIKNPSLHSDAKNLHFTP